VGRPLSLSPWPLWADTADGDPPVRPPLPGDRDADVVVVGAGFTGLWTAYYLRRADPALRVVVLEAETAGFGASGRNGGWCSALFPTSLATLARLPGSSPQAALAMYRAMTGSVSEVARVCSEEGIDCHLRRGGTIALARSRAQWRRGLEEVREARMWGIGEDDLRLLGPQEATQVAAATSVVGATFTPHCAAVHPLRLVRGLARAVEGAGAVVHEQSRVVAVSPGQVATEQGTVRADVVVRATEGFTPGLSGPLGHRRAVAPIYSMMVATEPLPEQIWEQIGLADRPTFSDHRHVVIYGQRTADGRLAFGGRGAPYHLGSRVSPTFDVDPRVHARLRSTLVEMFPVLREVRFTHGWGGPLGVPRDWCPSVGLDRSSGFAWAGGYVGDGVSTSNLAGRTLADLLLGRETERVDLPWVGHRSRRWEPEPLRWVGVNAALQAMWAADREEQLTGRPSRIARALSPLLGGR